MIILFIISLAIAYLLGSINSAIIVCKLMNLPDPRSQNSGNPGATNVLRVGGKQAAAIVLLGDVLKGFIPVLLASLFGLGGMAVALVALAAVIGHIFPLFFKFEGGKGVATMLGAILVLSFWLALLVFIVWVGVTAISRYVSLGSITAAIAAPVLTLFISNAGYFFPLGAIALLIIWRHMENIKRLSKGTEDKLKF